MAVQTNVKLASPGKPEFAIQIHSNPSEDSAEMVCNTAWTMARGERVKAISNHKTKSAMDTMTIVTEISTTDSKTAHVSQVSHRHAKEYVVRAHKPVVKTKNGSPVVLS